jgi:Right handed beta helix region
MTATWPRAIATGSVISAIVLLVALVLSMSSMPPNVAMPARTTPSSGAAPRGAASSVRRARRTVVRAPMTFYVAPNGRDSYRGTSSARPWRTIGRVNRASLRPGDRVLFEGGATFSDVTLMPGFGYGVSGTSGHPIVFGSYGTGRARLTQGVWLGTDASHPTGPSYLTFEKLALGPVRGFQGTGDFITLRGLSISHLVGSQSRQETGIASEGSNWAIEDNTIYDTGDSGMLLGFQASAAGDPAGGVGYLVAGNVVSHTGLDNGISYAKHAIYVKVADARLYNNRLTYFHDDGVSLRYRDASIVDNYIAHGSIGIAWYQYDSQPGTTELIDNTIAFTDVAAIFVCGVAESCHQPIENFVVRHNLLHSTQGEALNLQPTSGTYVVQSNLGLGGAVVKPALLHVG